LQPDRLIATVMSGSRAQVAHQTGNRRGFPVLTFEGGSMMHGPNTYQSSGASQSHGMSGDVGRVSAGSRQSCGREVNVSDTERSLSAIAGGGLLLFGLSRLSLTSLLGIAVGGSLLYRGLTGHCSVYEALGMTTAEGHPRGARARYREQSHPGHDVTDASLAATGESPPISR